MSFVGANSFAQNIAISKTANEFAPTPHTSAELA